MYNMKFTSFCSRVSFEGHPDNTCPVDLGLHSMMGTTCNKHHELYDYEFSQVPELWDLLAIVLANHWRETLDSEIWFSQENFIGWKELTNITYTWRAMSTSRNPSWSPFTRITGTITHCCQETMTHPKGAANQESLHWNLSLIVLSFLDQ